MITTTTNVHSILLVTIDAKILNKMLETEINSSTKISSESSGIYPTDARMVQYM